MERIVLHIGDSKTGSTALQTALRTAPKSTSWAYPGRSLNHNCLALALSRPKRADQVEPRFRQLWRDIAASQARTVVVSAELFQAVQPQDLMRALRLYGPSKRPPISVYAYCRPHLPKLIAMYSERAKVGQFYGCLADYAQKLSATDRLDFAPRFQAWRQQFDADFVLRPYLADRDVVEDFFAQALPDDPPPKLASRPNKSLTCAQIGLLHRVPRLAQETGISQPVPPEVHRLICLRLRKTGVGCQGSKPRLSNEHLRDFQRRYLQDAQDVDRGFFSRAWLEEALMEPAKEDLGQPQTPTSPSEVAWFDQMAREELRRWIDEPDLPREDAIRILRQGSTQ